MRREIIKDLPDIYAFYLFEQSCERQNRQVCPLAHLQVYIKFLLQPVLFYQSIIIEHSRIFTNDCVHMHILVPVAKQFVYDSQLSQKPANT